MLAMDVIEAAQTGCASPIVVMSKKVYNTLLSYRLVKTERNEDTRLVFDTAQGPMYQLVVRNDDVIDFRWKYRVWAD